MNKYVTDPISMYNCNLPVNKCGKKIKRARYVVQSSVPPPAKASVGVTFLSGWEGVVIRKG